MFSLNQANKNSPKKKKRKYSVESSSEKNSLSSTLAVTSKGQANTLIVNIIDRMVDLSKFNHHTGLYVLSRR